MRLHESIGFLSRFYRAGEKGQLRKVAPFSANLASCPWRNCEVPPAEKNPQLARGVPNRPRKAPFVGVTARCQNEPLDHFSFFSAHKTRRSLCPGGPKTQNQAVLCGKSVIQRVLCTENPAFPKTRPLDPQRTPRFAGDTGPAAAPGPPPRETLPRRETRYTTNYLTPATNPEAARCCA